MGQVFRASGLRIGFFRGNGCSQEQRLMRLLNIILLAAGLLGLPLVGFSAEHADPAATAQGEHPTAAAHAEGHGLPLKPVTIGHVPGTQIPITNSILVTWIVALALII